ncbi:MAG: class I SAM-dependent methyltransferase [Candidatus Helarchaeota archaeon]
MPKVQPFEKYFFRYETWFEQNEFAYKSEIQAIKEHIPKVGQGIEIGVGSGRFAAPLGIQFGLDPSKKMLKLAKKRRIETIKGVAEKLPFGTAHFHFALMVTTICFLDSIEAAFREIYRILKPNGRFLIGFIDKKSYLGKKYQKYKKWNVFYKIAVFYSVEDVIFSLKQAGFQHFHIIQTLFHDLTEIKGIEPIRQGYGKGAFIVIRAMK